MFSITELVESKGYKNFMKYVYGWGASVVLIGALFKIQHFPGASFMLTAGLIIEALIFFFSAFEPLHEELDWTLVYPELAGLTDEFDDDEVQVRKFDRVQEMPQIVGVPVGGGFVGGGGIPAASGDGTEVTGAPSGGGGVAYVGGGSPSALLKFDEMLEKADIGPEIFDKLGEGLNKLSKTAEKLSDMGDAGTATKDFVSKMQGASESIGKFDETYQKSSEALSESVSNLSESYSKSASTFNESSVQLTEAYTNFADKLTLEIDTVGSEGNAYSAKLGTLNSNLAALNTVYELQVKNINEQVASSNEYYSGLKGVVDNINETIEHTNKLNTGVKELESNIASLNSVYGNMLSSLNFNK
jgi:predicted  nucleic acid-binding Zn-ribbon protein